MTKPNSQSPDADEYRKHLAIALRDDAALDAVKEKRKANRKRAEKAGIDLKDMDHDKKMSTWSPSEVAKWFSRKLTYLGYRGVELGKQFDLFSGINPTVNQAPDFRPAGMYAAMKGQPCKPPSSLSQTDSQQWTEGWHEGAKFYNIAAEESELAEAAVRAMQADGEGEAGGEPAGDDKQVDLEQVLARGDDGEDATDEETLFLALGDFANATTLAECTLANYSGHPQDLEEAIKIVVEFDGEELVLKNRNGPVDGVLAEQFPGDGQVPEAEPEVAASADAPVVLSKGEDFKEDTPEDLKKQAGRKPSEALSQSAKAQQIRADAEKATKPKKPRSAPKPTDGPL